MPARNRNIRQKELPAPELVAAAPTEVDRINRAGNSSWLLYTPVIPEFRLIFYVASLYAVFITWGYLQEKITSFKYSSSLASVAEVDHQWQYPIVLNLFMTISGSLAAFLVENIVPSTGNGTVRKISYLAFSKTALTAAMASPIGYFSLRFLSFPMMILTKSSKPVPVMMVGKLFYNREFSWYKYVSVAMICTGIALFTSAKGANSSKADKPPEEEFTLASQLIGIGLVLINLSLDGVTSNEQDKIFAEHQPTSLQMMKYTNAWQAVYMGGFLLMELVLFQQTSSLYKSFFMLRYCSGLIVDILGFCICSSVGQILLFSLIKEFGSLVWITVAVTRQLFTILLSVFLFNHTVNNYQWVGIVLVFTGLGFEIFFTYINKAKTETLIAKTPSSDRLSNSSLKQE